MLYQYIYYEHVSRVDTNVIKLAIWTLLNAMQVT